MAEAHVSAFTPADEVLDLIDKAGDNLNEAMPDASTWGSTSSARAGAQAAEDMFRAG